MCKRKLMPISKREIAEDFFGWKSRINDDWVNVFFGGLCPILEFFRAVNNVFHMFGINGNQDSTHTNPPVHFVLSIIALNCSFVIGSKGLGPFPSSTIFKSYKSSKMIFFLKVSKRSNLITFLYFLVR